MIYKIGEQKKPCTVIRAGLFCLLIFLEFQGQAYNNLIRPCIYPVTI